VHALGRSTDFRTTESLDGILHEITWLNPVARDHLVESLA